LERFAHRGTAKIELALNKFLRAGLFVFLKRKRPTHQPTGKLKPCTSTGYPHKCHVSCAASNGSCAPGSRFLIAKVMFVVRRGTFFVRVIARAGRAG
jgi:hypothetical protein